MRTPLIVLALILLLAAAGAALYVFDPLQVRDGVEARVVRTGIQVLEGAVGARTLTELTATGERTIPVAVEGSLIDYSPDGHAIVFDSGTGSWEVVDTTSGTVRASGPNQKLWVSASPGGRFVTYAERTPFATPEATVKAVDVYDPAQWNVHVITAQTGSDRVETAGSMPRLFVRDGKTYLLYLLPDEVRVRVLFGEYQEYALPYGIDGLWAAEVSPDGKYLALFNYDRLSYDIFTFELADGAIALSPLAPVPGQVRAVAFSGTDLYALVWSPERSIAHLARIDLEDPGSSVVLSERPGLEAVRRIILTP